MRPEEMRVTAKVHLGIKKDSVQIAAGGDMGTAPPNRSREPRIAMTKLKDRAWTAKTGRSGLCGNRFRVDANLDTESSRNMLRGKWLGRAPHKPCATRARDPSSPFV